MRKESRKGGDFTGGALSPRRIDRINRKECADSRFESGFNFCAYKEETGNERKIEGKKVHFYWGIVKKTVSEGAETKGAFFRWWKRDMSRIYQIDRMKSVTHPASFKDSKEFIYILIFASPIPTKYD